MINMVGNDSNCGSFPWQVGFKTIRLMLGVSSIRDFRSTPVIPVTSTITLQLSRQTYIHSAHDYASTPKDKDWASSQHRQQICRWTIVKTRMVLEALEALWHLSDYR